MDPKKVREAFESGASKAASQQGRPERVMAPILHDDVPTFMEAPAATSPAELEGADVAVLGIPFEGVKLLDPVTYAPAAGRAGARGLASTTASAPTQGPTPSGATRSSTRCATAAASCPRPTATSSSSTICASSTTATSPSCRATSRRPSCARTRSSPTSSPPAPCRSSSAATTRSPSRCCRCWPASSTASSASSPSTRTST